MIDWIVVSVYSLCSFRNIKLTTWNIRCEKIAFDGWKGTSKGFNRAGRRHGYLYIHALSPLWAPVTRAGSQSSLLGVSTVRQWALLTVWRAATTTATKTSTLGFLRQGLQDVVAVCGCQACWWRVVGVAETVRRILAWLTGWRSEDLTRWSLHVVFLIHPLHDRCSIGREASRRGWWL